MHISNLFDPDVLEQMLQDGFVREQRNPQGDLLIFNYTEQAVYSRTWNEVTEQCRGLIIDGPTGEVMARPWRKFFNYGEHAADTLDLTAPVEVTDKEDGSLGILYTAPDGRPAIATRGSFTSEQALHATALYRERYEGKWSPAPGVTYLFEIVYPANRIVRDYGALDDLILLGAVHIADGFTASTVDIVTAEGWPGPVAQQFDYATLADALAAEPRPGAEGLVVRYLAGPQRGTMLKLKQPEYVALHRIVTGLTSRRIWERLAVWTAHNANPGQPLKQIARALHMDVVDVQGIIDAGEDWQETIERTAPEEFTDWIRDTVDDLRAQVRAVLVDVYRVAIEALGMDRKAAAEIVRPHPYFGLIFAEMDNKPYTAQAWYLVRPAAERPFRIHGEDVA